MKDFRLYLLHIAECIEKVERYTVKGPEALSDSLVYDAVLRNLQTLSEAAQRLPDAVKGRHSEIPWVQVGGFRKFSFMATWAGSTPVSCGMSSNTNCLH